MQTRPAEPGSRSFANTQKEERTIVLLLLHSPNPGSEPLSALTFVVASLVHGSYFFFLQFVHSRINLQQVSIPHSSSSLGSTSLADCHGNQGQEGEAAAGMLSSSRTEVFLGLV